MWDAIRVTILLAAVTTPLMLALATPVGWWLAKGGKGSAGWLRDMVAAVVALPIVLPPTVLGFYLLIAMGPNSPLMGLLQPFGVRTLAFTFTGLVIGSLVYSLPFAVQPIRNAFESMGPRPLEVAATLRASPWDAFWSVALPQARRGYVTAALLVFAHTIGEFGVVLMIGGSIPGQTEVVSIRIFQAVEQLNFAEAHLISGGLLAFSFVALIVMLVVDRRFGARSAGIRP
ncbi:molybdate ABC transporter permease subunit [Asticcacaulis sp. BYS171W]|uniref:Molybdenum transport system permease n=1 Tax=Asticcacaulis aquaticus TaxID=2984212 RepID=A0ABT5HWN8_9CAUL|nr:molybdate ABC transporter permease subunit [Asticcacaulis aquaticus]MDC7684454.1 molybdate ABC transporter permease subunit [Asticcacaulis aquaticus]